MSVIKNDEKNNGRSLAANKIANHLRAMQEERGFFFCRSCQKERLIKGRVKVKTMWRCIGCITNRKPNK